jgi:hypothetical protein
VFHVYYAVGKEKHMKQANPESFLTLAVLETAL